MVMLVPAAGAIDPLAIAGKHHVGSTLIGQRLQRPVDRGQ
jgi:hypothetical protein